MNRIIRHTEYLISRNDCVIIPGIGAVLANSQSAKIDSASGLCIPPRRIFGFNNGLTRNDGILINSIARASAISYNAAERIVAEESEAMLHQLKTQGELSLGKIGILEYDRANDTISFAPFDSDRLSVSTMWLSPVPAVALDAEQPVPEIQVTPIKTPAHGWIRALRVAASVALLTGICFVASTPVVIDDTMLASMAPEIKEVTIEDMMPAIADPDIPLTIVKGQTDPNHGYLWQLHMQVKEQKRLERERAMQEVLAAQTATATPAEAPGQAATAEVATAPVTAAAPAAAPAPAATAKAAPAAVAEPKVASGRYFVIVASMTSMAEANKFIKMHPHDNLSVLAADGRVRVYASAHNSRGDANRACRTAGTRYTGAWIYTRR